MDETEPKHAVVYMYNDNEGANFLFKALSYDRWLQKDFVFMALSNPSDTMKQKS